MATSDLLMFSSVTDVATIETKRSLIDCLSQSPRPLSENGLLLLRISLIQVLRESPVPVCFYFVLGARAKKPDSNTKGEK